MVSRTDQSPAEMAWHAALGVSFSSGRIVCDGGVRNPASLKCPAAGYQSTPPIVIAHARRNPVCPGIAGAARHPIASSRILFRHHCGSYGMASGPLCPTQTRIAVAGSSPHRSQGEYYSVNYYHIVSLNSHQSNATPVSGLNSTLWATPALAMRELQDHMEPRWIHNPVTTTHTVVLSTQQKAQYQTRLIAGHSAGQLLQWNENGWHIVVAYQATSTQQATVLATTIAQSLRQSFWIPPNSHHDQIVVSMVGAHHYSSAVSVAQAGELSSLFTVGWIQDTTQTVTLASAGAQMS